MKGKTSNIHPDHTKQPVKMHFALYHRRIIKVIDLQRTATPRVGNLGHRKWPLFRNGDKHRKHHHSHLSVHGIVVTIKKAIEKLNSIQDPR